MREIKFQFLYKGLPFTAENQTCNWFKKVYTLDQLIESPLSQLSDVHDHADLVAKRQYTGITNKNGVDVYERDFVICPMWDKPNEVFWDKDGFTCWIPELDDYSLSFLRGYMDFEVVGNAHQNPELREQ